MRYFSNRLTCRYRQKHHSGFFRWAMGKKCSCSLNIKTNMYIYRYINRNTKTCIKTMDEQTFWFCRELSERVKHAHSTFTNDAAGRATGETQGVTGKKWRGEASCQSCEVSSGLSHTSGHSTHTQEGF